MSQIEVIREFAENVLASEEFELGDPVSIENLTLVPILKKFEEDKEYLTLGEALEKGVLEIIDKGDEIAHVIAINKGVTPILLEEGDILTGLGTQDRLILGSMLLEPGKSYKVPVKCVHAPHPLTVGAGFGYGGSSPKKFTRTLRKYKSIMADVEHYVSEVDQSGIWSEVHDVTSEEEEVKDKTRFSEAIEKKKERMLKRSKHIDEKFPIHTVGLLAIDEQEKIVGFEVHRVPSAFEAKKTNILASLEDEIKENITPITEEQAKRKSNGFFQELSKIQSKDTQKQIEIEGLLLNLEEVSGEALLGKIYSNKCPKCGSPKPRVSECPECGWKEEVEDSLLYFKA